MSEEARACVDAWPLSGSGELVLPAPKGGGMSDMTFLGMLRGLEIPAVPHGFRSSFRDWAAEQSGADWAVCESAPAHQFDPATAR